MKKTLTTVSGVLATLLVGTGPAFAQFGGGTTQTSVTSGDLWGLQIPFITTNLDTTIAGIIGLVLVIAAVAAFFYLIFGGFMYITSGGDQAKADNGRKAITNAVIGIIIIALAYGLVRFVTSSL